MSERAAPRVLVTGGAGFIGSNLIHLIRDRASAVTVLDDLSAGDRDSLRGVEHEFVEGSILDEDVVAELVPKHDVIVHLAAQTGVPGSVEDPWWDCRLNVSGTLTLLEACRAVAEAGHAPPRFVFSSSNAPLGRQEPPVDETKAPLPMSPYGASKLAAEAYCLAYHGSWRIPTVVLRFANVYGPRCERKESVVAKFIKELRAGRGLVVDGDGGQTRDFIHVEDLCEAIWAGATGQVGGEVFHVATGEETSINELVEMVGRAAGRAGIAVEHADPRVGDIRRNYARIEKAQQMLDWSPKIGLEEGLDQVWRWFDGGC